MGQADVIDITAIVAGRSRLVVADVDSADDLAGKFAEVRRDVVPLIGFKVVALMRGVELVAKLIRPAGVAEVCAVGEDDVNGDARAVETLHGACTGFGSHGAHGIDPVG